MSRLAVIQASLPDDWPAWAARIVSDEAPALAANFAAEWSVEELAVDRSMRSIEAQLLRVVKRASDEAAEEQWWDRLDAWLDGLDDAIGREALQAMMAWVDGRLAKNPRSRAQSNGVEYRGEHKAPGSDDAPLWDLTLNGVYPNDVYGPMGASFYGIGDGSDRKAWSIAMAARGKPKKAVKIYRAVPMLAPKDERIADLENQKRFILKHGKIPYGVTTTQSPSAYYDLLHRSLQALHDEPDETGTTEPIQINPGDWVTIDRAYAVAHGEHSLGGKGHYRVLSKTVKASTLFTDGNSILEWGYNP